MLSHADGNKDEYRKILLTAIFQAVFFTLPLSAVLIALRVPAVRLVYGTKIFDWDATLETSTALSVFSISIVTQTLMSVLARAFFALHDTKTPVVVSFIGLFILVMGDFLLVLGFHLPVWALAAAFALSTIVEAIILLILINKRIGQILNLKFVVHFLKILSATLISGGVMFLMLKIFDKSVWVKRLSFLSGVDVMRTFPFEKFMLDTRYTGNVIILTAITFLVGAVLYTALSLLFRVDEAHYFLRVAKKIIFKHVLPQLPPKEEEPITTTDTQGQ